ncbi:phage tail assembly chaperone [Roseibium hamelinense]|nr:phage tail assembly chaperone [Roseibium hamelinense]MTI43699.1 phage tail assembly chaperone [Roseibium hamelinense]
MTAARPFPWAVLQQAAFVRLGWTPQTFWAATPREIGAALGLGTRAGHSGQPMTRAHFNALVSAYPDEPPRSCHE